MFENIATWYYLLCTYSDVLLMALPGSQKLHQHGAVQLVT